MDIRLKLAKQETVSLLIRLYPDDCPEYCRADLNWELTPEYVWSKHPNAKAVYLGGVTSGVVAGIDANGDEWSYQGTPRSYGEWHLAPQYSCPDAEGQEAVVATLQAEAAVKAAAEAAAQAKAEAAAKVAELLEQGLRRKELAAALASEAEAKRLRDIAKIRRGWRTINTLSWRNRAARNGGRSGFHADALSLLEKIEQAQAKAKALRLARQRREEEVPQVVAVKTSSPINGLGSAFAALGL